MQRAQVLPPEELLDAPDRAVKMHLLLSGSFAAQIERLSGLRDELAARQGLLGQVQAANEAAAEAQRYAAAQKSTADQVLEQARAELNTAQERSAEAQHQQALAAERHAFLDQLRSDLERHSNEVYERDQARAAKLEQLEAEHRAKLEGIAQREAMLDQRERALDARLTALDERIAAMRELTV